jgi:hypothetical protein
MDAVGQSGVWMGYASCRTSVHGLYLVGGTNITVTLSYIETRATALYWGYQLPGRV